VERVLGWNRQTVRKGLRELLRGEPARNHYERCGRKRAEEHFPNLLEYIRRIVEPESQTDPTFRTRQLYTPLTAREVHGRLAGEFGYRRGRLPCVRTISNKLALLEFRPQKVAKCKPLRKIPETDAIFAQVHHVNDEADQDPCAVRISLDTKAVVRVGELSRGGRSRQKQQALDHDLEPVAKLTPFGIYEPQSGRTHLWFARGPVTADFMVDRLEELWPQLRARQPGLDRLVLNADNGPESNGQRTQWLHRLVRFAQEREITVQLAYYPPYHSKYNPVERVWGVLENHWRGQLLSTVEKTLGLARSMTYTGLAPVVRMVRHIYQKGIRRSAAQMRHTEAALERLVGLSKWFITINPQP
jgi:hypothetical protein